MRFLTVQTRTAQDRHALGRKLLAPAAAAQPAATQVQRTAQKVSILTKIPGNGKQYTNAVWGWKETHATPLKGVQGSAGTTPHQHATAATHAQQANMNTKPYAAQTQGTL